MPAGDPGKEQFRRIITEFRNLHILAALGPLFDFRSEIVANDEAGYEWVLFARPLTPGETTDNTPTVQAGGPGARFLGNLGGLSLDGDDPLECELLWAIQLSALEGVRFIKVDGNGDEVAWTEELADILPFALGEAHSDVLDDDDDDDDDDPSEDGDDQVR